MSIPSTQEPPINYGEVKFGTKTQETIERSFVEIPGASQLWSLFYRYKGVFRYRVFAFDGSRQEAIERAKQHCAVQGLKLEWVEPLVVDLDFEDQKTLRGL